MATTGSLLEVLSYDECLAQLRRGGVGRLGWAESDRVVILPVNFAWDGQGIVFRTDPGEKVEGTRFQRVAFQIDGFEPARQEGWSVLANGPAQITEPERWPEGAIPPAELGLEPWAPGAKDRWVRLVPDRITGRRLVRSREGANLLWRYSAY
jgi:hypothetical protein